VFSSLMNAFDKNKTFTKNNSLETGQPFPAAIIFDMDGTLVATTEADFLAWQRIFKDAGRRLTFEGYFPLLGKKSTDVVYHVLNLQGEEAEKALLRKMKYFEEIIEEKGITLMPFAEKLLQQLVALPVPVGLATSSRKSKMQLVMEEVELLKYFDVLVSGEEVIHGKPDPEIFLLTAQKLGVDPSQCLVIEDAVSGVKAAKSAGMKCIAVTNTHPADDLVMADLVINDFSELTIQAISSVF
jgi:beta-phosphoglucomutase family hydrolase